MENINQIQQILVHAATAYDRRSSKSKYYNVYALAQYFMAIDKYIVYIQKNPGANLRETLTKFFNDRLLVNLQKAMVKAGY